MHKHTAVQIAWQPATTLAKEHGEIIADPLALLQSEAENYKEHWQAKSPPSVIEDGPREALDTILASVRLD